MQLSEYWQKKLALWNRQHAGPPITVRWNRSAIRRRRVELVYGVPVKRDWYEPRWEIGVLMQHRPPGMERLSTYLPATGYWFVRLFRWCRRNAHGQDAGFRHLDHEIFLWLEASYISSKQHFYRFVEEPEERAERAKKAQRADLAHEQQSKYRGWDSPVVSMDPAVKAGGDWRHRIR